MISVVIPTLNAEESLPAVLAALVPATLEGVVREVIVVDGGSRDRTVEFADHAGAELVHAPPVRGASAPELETGDDHPGDHADDDDRLHPEPERFHAAGGYRRGAPAAPLRRHSRTRVNVAGAAVPGSRPPSYSAARKTTTRVRTRIRRSSAMEKCSM